MKKHEIMEDIYHSALTFLVPLNSHDTHPLLVSEAIKLLHAKSGSIFLQKGDNFLRVYASSLELYDVQATELGKTKKAFDENRIFVESFEELVKKHPQFEKNKVGSDLCAPLTYNNIVIGVLSLQSFPGKKFSKDDIQKLELFLPLATLALRKSQLHDDVQHALNFRDMFISMASHELKTPLTAIYSYAQLIHRQASKDHSPIHKFSENLINATVRMKKLVEELLTVDNINNNELKYHLKQCEITKIVSRSITEFQASNPDSEVELVNELENKKICIKADYDKLIQVFTNIMDNARKYSPGDNGIKVKLQVKDSFVIVSVKDEGKGIKLIDMPHIFNPFYRGVKSQSDGKGLGLYIVKKIVEKHDGSVSVHSKVRKGTEVVVKFPIL